MEKTKLLVVEAHPLLRHGIRTLIDSDDCFQIIAEAADCEQAKALALQHEPDLILMGVQDADRDALQALRAIKTELPSIRVIMYTATDSDECLFDALKAGADGFLSKSVRPDTLVASLRAAARGEAVLSRRATARLLKEFARLAQLQSARVLPPLTFRERQILLKISQGLSNKEISHGLVLSESTVKTHVTHILRKLNLKNRYQAAAYVRQMPLNPPV